MAKVQDHIGEKFGFLTLLSDEYILSGHVKAYKCLCDCGNIHYARLDELLKGHTRSCGKCYLVRDEKNKSIAGKKFNKLTAIQPMGEDNHKRSMWLFKCDCGNECIKPLNNVKSGNTKSCGCGRHKQAANALNLVGEKFGRLTVIAKDKVENGVVYWKCQCSCGNIVVKTTGHLRNGRVKSCGCLVDDIQSKGSYNYKWAHDVRKLHEVCIKCGSSEHLAAHHIFPKNQYPEMRMNILNGITLCGKCHREFHHLYGHKCTLENLAEFIKMHPLLTKVARLMIEGDKEKSNDKIKEALFCLETYRDLIGNNTEECIKS